MTGAPPRLPGKKLKFASTLKRAGADAKPRYVVGTVAEDLAGIVANDLADLNVMGSQGHTGLEKSFLGSVASAVAVSCTKPLLRFRGGPALKRDQLHVGIALDGSPYGLANARFVAGYRDLFGTSPVVSLVHVVPDLTKITVPRWIERELPTGIKPDQVEAKRRLRPRSGRGGRGDRRRAATQATTGDQRSVTGSCLTIMTGTAAR